jgi:uncharacterized protein (DUF1778 family)
MTMSHDDDILTEPIAFRATEDQRARWEKAAALDRRTLSDWIRLALDDAATAKKRKH